MTIDEHAVDESKKAFRRRLASLPFAQKLRLLDALRERTLAITSRRAAVKGHVPDAPVREPGGPRPKTGS